MLLKSGIEIQTLKIKERQLFKRDIGKQCRFRSKSTLFALNTGIPVQQSNNKNKQSPCCWK